MSGTERVTCSLFLDGRDATLLKSVAAREEISLSLPRQGETTMRGRWGVGPLLGLAAILAVIDTMYAIHGELLPEGVQRLSAVSLSLFVVYWVMIDARQTALRPVPRLRVSGRCVSPGLAVLVRDLDAWAQRSIVSGIRGISVCAARALRSVRRGIVIRPLGCDRMIIASEY